MRILTRHGTNYDDCQICDIPLTYEEPGIEWSYKEDDTLFFHHVCNECFNEPDYQAIVKRHEGKIKKYP